MNIPTELSRIFLHDSRANPVTGEVRWSPIKSLWVFTHTLLAIIGGAMTLSLDAVAIFIITTATTLCLGHSLGMHRRLIHNSYECPRWLEHGFVHLGVLVGLAGPFGMVHAHDLRDWAQRQPACHPYLRHGSSFWKDAWWQLHCDLHLKHPPAFHPEPRISRDPVLRFMEQTWMLQQLPLALLLFFIGGLPWVIWGVSVRVMVSVTGHWLIGYFAHNSGEMDNEVLDAAVQGHNVKWVAHLTMGESWHNNHHAYPGSALLGLYANQADPGWRVLNALHNLGLVWNIVLPENLPSRANLRPLTSRATQGYGEKHLAECAILKALS
ncbi:acyl-CoA desaturase [Thiothrix lacustris]|uniref:Acyl-CoA desaturase n=1 Tax=Thiothrix lacustris TaxID=525917 RepID=A0ABY9MKX3_9GAMM|nr:acyl-CoA desaturase [Thiothrix lacustris]WML89329.1 acyl-CoA desaturase [Thiothrix lacustris]